MITSSSTIIPSDVPFVLPAGLYVVDDSDTVILMGNAGEGMVVITNPDVNDGFTLWDVVDFTTSEVVLHNAESGGTLTVTQG